MQVQVRYYIILVALPIEPEMQVEFQSRPLPKLRARRIVERSRTRIGPGHTQAKVISRLPAVVRTVATVSRRLGMAIFQASATSWPDVFQTRRIRKGGRRIREPGVRRTQHQYRSRS